MIHNYVQYKYMQLALISWCHYIIKLRFNDLNIDIVTGNYQLLQHHHIGTDFYSQLLDLDYNEI